MLTIFFTTSLASKLLYLDPGSGSFILQILLAAILGAGVLIRAQWANIKKMFGKKSKTEDEDEDADSE